MLKTLRRATRGFTLIELLVVIAIIGLLASIVLVSLTNARRKARDSRRIGDLRQVQLALELYFDAQAAPSYPRQAATGRGVATDYSTGLAAALVPTHMTSLPLDPLNAAPQVYLYAAGTIVAPATTATACTGTATCVRYLLGVALEDPSNPAYGSDVDNRAAAAASSPGGWSDDNGLSCGPPPGTADTAYCVGN